jgi:hypothetical protein
MRHSIVDMRSAHAEPMKSRIPVLVLDVKIGAVRDRPTQSVQVTCVCRPQERRRIILAIPVHLAVGTTARRAAVDLVIRDH